MPVSIRRFMLMVCMSCVAMATTAAPLIVDGDGDAISDEIDDCPYTHMGIRVDSKGCPRKRDDGDLDGVTDEDDSCPYTVSGAVIDVHGCAIDSDFDGVANGVDRCPRSPLSRLVDAQGCASGERAQARVTPPAASQPLASPTMQRAGVTADEAPKLIVRFAPGSMRLGTRDQSTIASYARFFARRLAANPSTRLMLRGVAEAAEPQAAALAVARLIALRQQLEAHGIKPDRIRADSRVIRTAGLHRRVEAEIVVP